ncbi:MAG: anion transporter [Ruminiclostridium sp.]|nr:anion transporter [Ruminiclostridium sp.]
MSTQLLNAKHFRRISPIALFKKDIVLSVSFFLAVASSLVLQPKISYINFRVLICLFNLMIVIKAFEELMLLDKFAVDILNRCTDTRKVSLTLILLSFFTSMLITNDISLITLVPLTLIISRKSRIDMLSTIILQTLAANIGSSLTPMGNPQNLYIYSFYTLTPLQFFAPVALFTISGLIWLLILNHRRQNSKLDIALDTVKLGDRAKTVVWAILFIIIILSVFGAIHYLAALLITLAVTLIVNRKLIFKIDYLLLITFTCFFIFIGNISGIPALNNYMEASLNNGKSTYFASILLSQFISNVPSSVLLSGFTSNWKELLIGVNVGGMGTIIASLASVISYKLFIRENPSGGKNFILKFSLYNFISLIVFAISNYFLIVVK